MTAWDHDSLIWADLSQSQWYISSVSANFWQKHTAGNVKQAHVHGPIYISFFMYVLYLVEASDASERILATSAASRSSCHWTGVTANYYPPDWSYLLGNNWLAQNYLPGINRLAKNYPAQSVITSSVPISKPVKRCQINSREEELSPKRQKTQDARFNPISLRLKLRKLFTSPRLENSLSHGTFAKSGETATVTSGRSASFSRVLKAIIWL